MAGPAPRRLLALALTSQLTVSIVQWGGGALGPDLMHRYHLSAAGLGALLSAGAVGNALARIVAGGVIDRIGARRPLIAGGLVAGTALAVGGLAAGAWTLGAALLVFGTAGAFVAIAGTVSVFHSFPAERRGTALGIRQTAVAGGGLVASVLLPGLAALGGVPLSLAVTGVLVAVPAVLFGLVTVHGPAVERHRGPGRLTVLRIPGIRRVLLVGLLQVSVLTALLTFAVPAVRAGGASAVGGSAVFATISLAGILARLTFGRLADAGAGTRRREALRDAGRLAVAGALATWAVSGSPLWAQIPVVFAFAFGALGFNGVLYTLAGELAGPARAGQAVGLAAAVLFGGSALAAVPLGVLADHAGYRALWPAAAILGTLGLAVIHGLPRRSPAAAALEQSA
jgi:MFS family permease